MPRDADLFVGVLPFVQTAEARSFSRAAVTLGVSTAAISKSIKKLEDDLGVKLLERNSRLVTLTAAGQVFLDRCRTAVLSVKGAREVMKSTSAEPQGELSVTLPFILAPFVVPNLGGISAQYPRLSFRLNMTDRLARLADEGVDVAIRMGALKSSTLIARLLRKTRWVTIAAPGYLSRYGTPKSPVDLAAHNCLRFMGTDGKAVDWTFRRDGRAAKVDTQGNLLTDHGSSLVAGAEAGMGLAQVLDFMVEAPLRQGSLIEVLGAFASAGPHIHALTTPGRVSSTNVRAFMRFLVDAFRP